ncbi:ferritin-like domain-containing protein [Microcoleus sp. ZQ-A2]|nr:ferritin-like domain-containing protein [Microcoleus sp. FACHB-1]
MSDINPKTTIISSQRRQLLKLGLFTGATSALAIALGSGSKADAQGSRQNRRGDIEILNGAIALEQKAINTYTAAAENKLLPTKAFLDVAVQFAGDHANHRDQLKKIVSREFRGTPISTDNLGTFPIPQNVLKGGEAEVLRYALTLEMIAAKAYLENVTTKLTTDAAKNVAATIMPVESMHAAVFRTVLMAVLNEKGLPMETKIVPHSFLSEFPTPPLPRA